MKEIIDRLHGDRQNALAKSILESAGYSVFKPTKLKESVEDEFWELHDRDYDTGIELENIISKLGLDDKFFTDDTMNITATKEDYNTVLDIYRKNHISEKDYSTLLNMLKDLGFSIGRVSSNSGTQEYHTKGNVGVLIGDVLDIKSAAKYIL